jgi:hypothetical protein
MGEQYTVPKAVYDRNGARAHLFTFKRLSLAFIGALCIGWLIVWLLRIGQNIGMPQIEYSESYMIYISHLFGTGQWSWNIQQPDGGVMVSFYTPIFYWILGQIMNIFGYHLMVGRILVLLSFVGCCIFIYLIVQYLSKNKIYSIIAAMLPLTQPFVNAWSLFVRVDFMALLFEMAGIYIAIRFWKSWWFLLSILFFALGFYTKQSTLAGAAAVCIFILIKNWRFAITYACILVLAIGVPFLIASLVTHGQFFKEIVLYQHVSPLFRPWRDVQGYLTVAYIELFPILIIGLWNFVKNITSIPAIFSMLALLLNIAIITRPGGAQNYFFEVILAMSLVTGLTLPEIIEKRNKFFVCSFIFVLWSLSFNYQLTLYPGPVYQDNVTKAESIVQDATHPIFTENADIVISAGKIPYGEPFVFNNLNKFGYWDEKNLLEDMKSGRMEYVITQNKMPSEAAVWRIDKTVQQTIVDKYHVILDASDKVGYGFVVYKTNKE